MTASKIFLYFCLSFIGGIFLNSIVPISQIYILGALILGILLISVLPCLNLGKKAGFVVIGFCILFLLGGIWRHQRAEFKIANNELQFFNTQERVISLIGIKVAEPDIRERSVQLTIAVQSIDGEKIKTRAKVLVTTNKEPEYRYGDKLIIKGNLKAPPEFPDFNYRNFLAKKGIYSVMSWPEIELLSKNYGNPVYSNILSFKERLRKSIEQNLSPPQSSILGAIILGDKGRMSEDLKEKLSIVGIRHITAISGMHITILSIILMQALIGLGLWRGQAFYFTLFFLILFIVMVGLPSSAVRAGIMGSLFLFAQKIGRVSATGRIIVFAAAGMLVVNPLLLLLDIGFQLSFLAVLGIIYLGPHFNHWLKKIFKEKFFNLRGIIAMTLAAQIFTLPILVYNFGRFSLIAPLTNVLILPLLPFIFGLGFLFGLVGIIFPFLGWIFSWPAWLLLTYLTSITNWFSQISWAALTIENIHPVRNIVTLGGISNGVHWVWLIIFYLILGLITWQLEKTKIALRSPAT